MLKQSLKFVVAGTLGAILSVNTALAADLICRGANRPFMARQMEKAIRVKLHAEGVKIKRLNVSLKVIAPREKKDFDHLVLSSGLSVTLDPFSLSSSGVTYPSPEDCTLSVQERIMVVTKDNKISRSNRTISMDGHLLSTGRKFNDSEND